MDKKPLMIIDFETRSEVDLPNEGLMKYAKHKSTEILMTGYMFGGPQGQDNIAHIWEPDYTLPDLHLHPEDFDIYAFNAEFELAIWNEVGVRKYGFSSLKLENITCIQSLCARYGLPQNLENAAFALRLKTQKNPEGKLLIKLFCIPPFKDNFKQDQRYERFREYCRDDVRTEKELLYTLPASILSKEERWIWEQTVLMNLKGIPIDTKSVKQIRRVTEQYREAHYELLPDMTDGLITKISQTSRIIKYAKEYGVHMPDCTAHTVSELLDSGDLPDNVLQLLDMRTQLGLSSVGKYVRMEDMNYEGRSYYNQRYYGAATGRWTGTGVQLLNLPRAKVADPDAEIDAFFDGSIVERNPIKSARALIRPMIKAPDGHMLHVADYDSIEYVIIEWLADNHKALKRFAEGYEQYIDMAMSMYNVTYDEVTLEQRREGKVIVLGCGFGQGAKTLMKTADKQWGMKLEFERSRELVNAYRSEHKPVVNMWYTYQKAAQKAIETGKPQEAHKCKFNVIKDHTKTPWLVITLPSGRNMYYYNPWIGCGMYGDEIMHYGFNQTIKKWVQQSLIPGRITENIVQGIARDVLINGMKNCISNGFNIIWTVYDEIICEEPETNNDQAEYERLVQTMCSPLPAWAKGLPVKAKGYYAKRYRKD